MDFTRHPNREKYPEHKKMTQQDVVAQLQLMGSMMSRSTLANIETGRRNIKASDLKALRIILDVDYEEFFRD